MSALAASVIRAARERGLSLGTAESCTGGLIAAALTDVPGSSSVVLGGVVSYAVAVKEALLEVPPEVIVEHGVVSEEVARAMARGARAGLRADLVVATTGVAGPGPSGDDPEGRVCFALTGAEGTLSVTVDFGALGRAEVRRRATDYALDMLLAALQP
ncbi:nicotinamide-nucleotide amidase [Pseudooceanicola antarcticus]|uniref:CinA family protein n=1 Tax=Pseudooceanicola antarcticus TaxID=1247613 RepID=A0A285J1P3_9RHOB|nr:CinA family protein [Pseudooceanicola antarcticus]PJE25680.1 CinA family protein [Pseudooceanicola antarcticus]SNY53286.1 nicotinamide-nucleotide amidase [Pseudooceanicola antarcticus]